MSKSNMPFDGEFSADKTYLITGRKILEWRRNYYADRALPGRGMEVAGTPQGRIFHAVAENNSTPCALGSIIDDPANAGQLRMAPGSISGGGKSIALTFDNFTPKNGDYYYIEVDWTAREEDDVLLAGGTMNSAKIKIGTNYPDDDDFTASSLNGKFVVPLGRWVNDQLEGASCGNVGVSMCPNDPRFWRA